MIHCPSELTWTEETSLGISAEDAIKLPVLTFHASILPDATSTCPSMDLWSWEAKPTTRPVAKDAPRATLTVRPWSQNWLSRVPAPKLHCSMQVFFEKRPGVSILDARMVSPERSMICPTKPSVRIDFTISPLPES